MNNDLAPDFNLTDIYGFNFKLSDYLGKVVLINFMATWCSPCSSQILELVEVYENFSKDTLEMISIDIDLQGTNQQLQSYVDYFIDQGYQINWPFALDTNEEKVTDKYQINAIPTNVIVDYRGYISYIGEGLKIADELVWEIEKASKYPKLIYGKITNLSRNNDFISFQAINIKAITLNPFSFNSYSSGAYFEISKEYNGFIGENYIFALVNRYVPKTPVISFTVDSSDEFI